MWLLVMISNAGGDGDSWDGVVLGIGHGWLVLEGGRMGLLGKEG